MGHQHLNLTKEKILRGQTLFQSTVSMTANTNWVELKCQCLWCLQNKQTVSAGWSSWFSPPCHSSRLLQRHKDADYVLPLGPVGVMHDKGILFFRRKGHYWVTQWTQQRVHICRNSKTAGFIVTLKNRVINLGDGWTMHAKCLFAESQQWVFVI